MRVNKKSQKALTPLSRKIMSVKKKSLRPKRTRKLYAMEWGESKDLQKWFNRLGKMAGKPMKGRGKQKTYVALSDVLKTLAYGFIKFPVGKQVKFIKENVPAEFNPSEISLSRLVDPKEF